MDEVPLYLAYKKTAPPGPYTRPMTRELWMYPYSKCASVTQRNWNYSRTRTRTAPWGS